MQRSLAPIERRIVTILGQLVIAAQLVYEVYSPTNDQIFKRLLALNLERAAEEGM